MVSLLDDPLAIAPLMWNDGESWNSTDEAVLDRVEEEVEELAPHTARSTPIRCRMSRTV
jgi:spermidine/putrescine transport system substrate-binding protein